VRFGGAAAEHPYFSLEFREKLRALAYQKLINADFVHSATGGRFPKDVTETPIFQAIRYLRGQTQLLENLSSETIRYLRRHSLQFGNSKGIANLPPIDGVHAQTLARYVLQAVCSGRVSALEDLIALVRLQSKSNFEGRVSESQKFIPWSFYAADSALYYLNQGVLPTRAQVKDGAIRRRVVDELLTSKVVVRAGSAIGNRALVNAKFADVTGHNQPKNWPRIFRELGLAELP
jgi:hypothetical protein